MIIKFYDKDRPPITISDDRGELLRREVNKESPKHITIEGHGTFAKSDIRSMVPSTVDHNDRYLQIPAHVKQPVELSDEDREHRLVKIKELKRKFNQRRKHRG